MVEHNDFLKKPLAAGDDIVFIHPHHRQLVVGKVHRVMPKKIEVAFMQRGRPDYTFRFPEDVVRV